jgi:putative transposase
MPKSVSSLPSLTGWKKNLADTSSRTERLGLIEREKAELPITLQAKLLGLSRSSLYYKPVPVSPEEIRLKHRIDEIYTELPFYGSRKIIAQLQLEGVNINRKRVQDYMREMGISGICPGPNLSKRNLAHRLYPYLLSGVTASYPNHIWGTDITYIRLRGGWLYLIAIIDWYSRYIVGWELDQSLEIGFVLRTVEQALRQAIPVIFNSDQGSHFTSPKYTELVIAAGAQVSMDGRGRAIDNIFTERFWRSIKYENVYLRDYESPKEARAGIGEYIEFYNWRRLHQSLGYHTPARVYQGEVRLNE